MQRFVALVAGEATAARLELGLGCWCGWSGLLLLVVHVEVLEGVGDIKVCFEDTGTIDGDGALGSGRELSSGIVLGSGGATDSRRTVEEGFLGLLDLALVLTLITTLMVLFGLALIILSHLVWVLTSK